MALTVDDGDRLMARLIEARDSLPEGEVEPFFARLVLIMADEIGDLAVLVGAVDAALPVDTAPPGEAFIAGDDGSG